MASGHKWEPANQHMRIEEETGILAGNLPFLVDPTEAERFVESLEFIEVEEIGSSKWMKQHEYIEKLNLQVHSFILPLRLIYIIILIIIDNLVTSNDIRIGSSKCYVQFR